VTDVIGEQARDQVAAVVEQATHRDYFRITVSQGIVIDPRHPEQATVFALVIDESALGAFRNRLKDAFKDRLHEDEIDPSVVTQLADIGQVVALPPHPVGDVIIPPSSKLAIRTRDAANHDSSNQALTAAVSEHDQPTTEQERSAPGFDPTRSGRPQHDVKAAAGPPRSSETDESIVREPTQTPTPGESPQIAGSAEPLRRDRQTAGAESQPGESPGVVAATGRSMVVLVWVTGTRSG
jgi:hypothetical protein